MKTLHAVVLALLLGSSAAVSTGAAAATPSSALRATATEGGDVVVGSDARPQPAIGGYRLAQYGGGDDDDDDRPARSSPGGGYSNPGGGNRGGGVNAGDVMNIIRGVGSMIDNAGRQQRQQQQNRDYQIQRQEQARRAAQEAERRKRQQQEAAKERARRQAEERNLQKERQRIQEERSRLQNEAKQNELDRQRQDAIRQQQDQYQPQNPYTPNPPPQQAQQNYPDQRTDEPHKVPDKIDNTPITIIVEQYDVYPPPNEIPRIPVGRIEVPACGYVNLPADRRLCAGTTASGGWLRVVNVPTFGGGTRPACVQYCRNPVQPPIRIVTPVVPVPNPVPTPIPCAYPPCGPNPQVEPPTTDSTETLFAKTTIEPNRPETDSTETTYAKTTIEPNRPETDSTETTYAKPTIQPDRPETDSTETTYAKPTIQPDRPETDSTETTYAKPTIEPDRPETDSRETVVAISTIEPVRPETDSRETIVATPTIAQNDRKPPQDRYRCATPPCGSIADDDSQTDTPQLDRLCAKPPCGPAPTAKLDDQRPSRLPNKPSEGGQLDSIITPTDGDDFSSGQMTPPQAPIPLKLLPPPPPPEVTDSKGCTPKGGLALATLRNRDDLQSRLTDHPQLPGEYHGNSKSLGDKVEDFGKKAVTDGAKKLLSKGVDAVVPGAGALLGPLAGPVIDLIWKTNDPDPNKLLFDQMKNYVDTLVPELIKQDHDTTTKQELAGLQAELDQFYTFTHPEARRFNLLNALADLAKLEPKYSDVAKDPERKLAPFIAFAGMHLAVLQELEKNYEAYLPPKDAQARADQHTQYANAYNKYRDKYLKAIEGLREGVMNWRLGKLRVDEQEISVMPSRRNYWSSIPRKVAAFTARDDFCDWHGPEREISHEGAQQTLDDRKKDIRDGFGRSLDILLEPITSFPAVTIQAAPVQATSAPDAAPKPRRASATDFGLDSIEPAAGPQPSPASAASCSASADQCNSQCGFVMSPGPGGMMTMNADQACADRCSQQAAVCRANAAAPQRTWQQQLQNQRNREAAAEDARVKAEAAENRRVLEQLAAEQREAAAERGRLDRAADEEFRNRQRRDAEIQVQQSRQNVYAQCAQQCAMMESACLGYNPAADNVQTCQRQGNDCRSTCGKDPGFLPKSFTAIQPPPKKRGMWDCGPYPCPPDTSLSGGALPTLRMDDLRITRD